MKKLLCCDWGTSAFRLKLVDVSTAGIPAEESGKQGIGQTFELWQQLPRPAKERMTFYLDYIQSHISLLEHKTGISLKKIPLIISGMASSSVGLKELPYKRLPFTVDGSDLVTKKIVNEKCDREIILISGVRSADDVMRGEETLLVGSASNGIDDGKENLFIFPGTHSKHILVKDKQAIALQTFMTGEFFDLLAHKSILSHSVSINDHFQGLKNQKAFEKGMLKGIQSNLLNSCFNVRTNSLFNIFDPEENYYFLSGSLIGYELKEIMGKNVNITLVSDGTLLLFYKAALKILHGFENTFSYKSIPADKALIRGQIKIYTTLNNYHE
jgi:2-dehydro-3-deoxygalactonokinase